MICYRDMTFCKEDGCKKFSECPRALTEKIKKDAEEFGLPIMQFASIPKCYIISCNEWIKQHKETNPRNLIMKRVGNVAISRISNTISIVVNKNGAFKHAYTFNPFSTSKRDLLKAFWMVVNTVSEEKALTEYWMNVIND